MLVLTRKQQEKIRIGDNIVITVLRTKGKAVRLGIEAPESIAVIRGELAFEARSNEKVQAQPVAETSIELEVVRTTVPAARKSSNWSPAARENGAPDRLPGTPKPQVSFERVPREQLAQALPGLGGSEGPLRAMLNRRSLSA